MNFTYYTGSHAPFEIESDRDYLALNAQFIPLNIAYLYQHNPRIKKPMQKLTQQKKI